MVLRKKGARVGVKIKKILQLKFFNYVTFKKVLLLSDLKLAMLFGSGFIINNILYTMYSYHKYLKREKILTHNQEVSPLQCNGNPSYDITVLFFSLSKIIKSTEHINI